MSTSKAAQFTLENATQPRNEYFASHTEFVPVNDSNSNVYTSGQLMFNNMSIMGSGDSGANKLFLLPDSYVVMPIEYSAVLTGGTWRLNGAAVPANKYAVSKKSNLAFVEQCHVRLGHAPLTGANDFQNVYNSAISQMKNQEQARMDEEAGEFFDSTESIRFSAAVGEVNCQSVRDPGIYTKGPDAYNQALWQRNQHFLDVTDYADGLDTSMKNPFFSLLNGSTTLLNTLQPHFEQTSTTTLTWRDVCVIKLAHLSDVLKNTPPLCSLQGLEIRLHTNLAAMNSWTVTYEDIGAEPVGDQGLVAKPNIVFHPASVSAQQNVGNTCPWICAQAANAFLNRHASACTFTQSAAETACSVKISGKIGWTSQTWPCKLYLACATYAPQVVQKIINQPSFEMHYNEVVVDSTSLTAIPSNSLVQKSLQSNFSRLRRMFIIPCLNKASNGTSAVAPYQSVLSSFPRTASICKIKNLQISLGGSSPLFTVEPLSYPFQHYDYYREAMATNNGNAVNSMFLNGQVTARQWNQGYGFYVYDLQRVLSAEEDDVARILNLSFTVDGKAGILWDFFIIIETQRHALIDRITSAVANQ
jgi:hypothetical protein